MTAPATLDRRRLADELLAVGPDADTLCEGWTARDLAAHIVLRDRRPDAMAGVLIPAFAGYTQKVQDTIATKDWDDLVALVREPPKLSPSQIERLDRLTNTHEFFVHLEDVRRARAGWEPRDLDAEHVADVVAALGRMAKPLSRKVPVGITLVPDGGDPIVAKRAEPMVTVRGPAGELMLFVFGRQDHARVALDGDPDAVEQARTAAFGL
ncbi:MAG: TIGR03085 family protein [Acidimicrobiaceae bacterium]|nr:TIGR03085 family protein [Acidimicrobiaceae bacterium]